MFLISSSPAVVTVSELLRVFSFYTVSILVYTLAGMGICRDGVFEFGRPSFS